MTNEQLLDAMREIYEVYAGSESVVEPITLRERYILGMVEEMRDIAGRCLTEPREDSLEALKTPSQQD